MQNQRGIVLAGSLMILSALALAGVAARVMLQNDHRTSANLRTGFTDFLSSRFRHRMGEE